MNLFQRLRNLFGRGHEENGYYPELDEEEYEVELEPVGSSSERQLFTALDIGTAYAKAMIIEVHGDSAEVLGVGHHPQSYTHMSDGIVTDIPGVIANCNKALLKAEQAAGGLSRLPRSLVSQANWSRVARQRSVRIGSNRHVRSQRMSWKR
ncbi:hypothetical protein [Ktedonobacter robiniae]|uniref:SHS2 domain-containing protein n=1 Tax=Ktedonobacter robiniae TaxID=2778365 RepID=A0ABQ3UMD3_9CHLR|nr:hypothetical protein [Ktedonobacter robiniae]GHO53850.1 hypothetical protein KSB_23250 [Ktedonobacter robiniae]